MNRYDEMKAKELSSKPIICIGIDTGTNTGIAIWRTDEQRFRMLGCMPVHTAMSLLKDLFVGDNEKILVRIEDARKRKWFGFTGRARLQGAGSIKRDAKIWEDFLKEYKVPFELVAPSQNMTKLSAAQFKKITGWEGRTNEHERDAAMLVYGYK